MSDVYRQLSASSLTENNGIGIYILNDAADRKVEYNLIIDVFTYKVGLVYFQVGYCIHQKMSMPSSFYSFGEMYFCQNCFFFVHFSS